MERRALGDSGLEVSVLALGTWALGATVETWGPVDDRESIAAIHQALDCGVNLIDTAPIYGLGHSEEIIGKAIQGRRDEVIIATKCGLLFPRGKDRPPKRCLAPDSIVRECDESLRRLRIDTIDLYLCHWPDPDTPLEATFEALDELRTQGKIRAIGVSNFSCEELRRVRALMRIDAVQPPFSMIHPRAAEDLLPYCQEYGIAVLAYSPLAKGLLTGKFDADSKFEGIRAGDPDFVGPRYRRNLQLIAELRPIAESYGKSVTQLVLNWTAAFPGVTAPVVGAKRPSQVIENVGALGWSLSDEDRRRIDGFREELERGA